MTELESENALLAFAKNANASFHYNKFLNAIKSKNSKSIEETKVFDVLHRMITIDNPMKHSLQNRTVYRCRIIREKDWNTPDIGIDFDENGIAGFDKYNSKEPPLGFSPAGRANHSGVSYLYVADNPYTACAEVRPHLNDCISVGVFKICKSLTILDFSENQNLHSLSTDEDTISVAKLITHVMMQFASCVNDSDDYLATQYISDYIRKHGIDGICYRSSLTNGKNYAIFNCSEENIKFASSSIYYCNNIVYELIDINQEKICRKKKKRTKPKVSEISSELKRLISRAISTRKTTS